MTLEYDSEKLSNPFFREVTELWRYRDLLWLLIANSIKTRYKRSTLGIVWTLLNPLLNTLVLTIAFSQLMRFDVKSYPIYLLTGMIFWNFFAQTTLTAASTLVWGSGLLKRVYIPRTIFAVSTLGNGLVNYVLALIPLIIIMLALGHPVRPSILLLPIPVLITSLFTLGIALFVSAMAVFFTDVVDLYNNLIQVWFYLTPIWYPLSIVPPRWAAILRWNPINLMLEQVRAVIYDGVVPSWHSFLLTGIISLVVFLLGWWIFTKRVDELAYRI
jgi:ABC-2 type transport system permease protein